MQTLKRIYRLIYFVRGEQTGLIKIGSTSNIDGRIKDMQIGSPDKLMLVGLVQEQNKITEAYFHRRFAEKRRRGEWFDLNDEDLQSIEWHQVVTDEEPPEVIIRSHAPHKLSQAELDAVERGREAWGRIKAMQRRRAPRRVTL